MQKLITLVFISASIVLASCGSKTDNTGILAQKKATLDSLQKEQLKINDAIVKLQNEIAKIDTGASSQKSALVSYTAVTTSNFKHYIDLQGKVEAVNISYIAPRNGTGGLVKELYVQKGQEVKKGQLLLKLDDVLALQAIKTAKQNLAAVQAVYNNYADVYKRRKNLFDQGIGTIIQLNGDKAAADNALAQLNGVQENIKTLEQQLNFTSVYSDVDGVAEDVNVRVGEMFVGAVAGVPQIKIVNTGNLKVTTQVPENYITKVNTGDSVLVGFPDINKNITAKISLAGKIIDPNSRSFYIEIHMPADKDLKPNQITSVKIQDYTAPNTIIIPVNVLQTDENGKYVLVAETAAGKLVAKKKAVTVGQSYADKVQVLTGLQAGDKIITEGFQSLYDGQPLTVATN
jgi:RND family efflux transporter MFP subunit